MAELTTTAQTIASSCCLPEAQATCCEPSAFEALFADARSTLYGS